MLSCSTNLSQSLHIFVLWGPVHPLEPRFSQIGTVHRPFHPLPLRHTTAYTLLLPRALQAYDIRPDPRDVRIVFIGSFDSREYGTVDFDAALSDVFVHLAAVTPIDPASG
jgi:hypothetical protein